MTPIYISSIGIAGLMVLAAAHNRRSGWRRERSTAVRDLYEMGALFKGLDSKERVLESPQVPGTEPANPEAEAAFSSQLVNLQSALHQENRVVPGSLVPAGSPLRAKTLA